MQHQPTAWASLEWLQLKSTVYMALQESKALLLPQRLATWYLLFSTWPDGPAGNPFVSFLFRVRQHCAPKQLPCYDRHLSCVTRVQQDTRVQAGNSKLLISDTLTKVSITICPAGL